MMNRQEGRLQQFQENQAIRKVPAPKQTQLCQHPRKMLKVSAAQDVASDASLLVSWGDRTCRLDY